MIAKEELLEKYNISDEFFQDADISWEDLVAIYDDFKDCKHKKYEEILAEFQKEYLSDLETAHIHSVRTRVKDAEHLIVKIIRKKKENYIKYKNLTKDNYEKFLTDLIGIRCFVLFKEDWKRVHEYIISKFENNPKYYIRDSLKDFDDDVNHIYIAENPKAHIRTGDRTDIYEGILDPDCIKDDKIYRSVHYILKYKGVYLEIQVRTLYEEGWGEIDHAMVYPYYEDDPVLKQYTELLNRLSGLADEMGSFFRKVMELEKEHLSIRCNPPISQIEEKHNVVQEETSGSMAVVDKGNTPKVCLEEVLKE